MCYPCPGDLAVYLAATICCPSPHAKGRSCRTCPEGLVRNRGYRLLPPCRSTASYFWVCESKGRKRNSVVQRPEEAKGDTIVKISCIFVSRERGEISGRFNSSLAFRFPKPMLGPPNPPACQSPLIAAPLPACFHAPCRRALSPLLPLSAEHRKAGAVATNLR